MTVGPPDMSAVLPGVNPMVDQLRQQLRAETQELEEDRRSNAGAVALLSDRTDVQMKHLVLRAAAEQAAKEAATAAAVPAVAEVPKLDLDGPGRPSAGERAWPPGTDLYL